MFCARVCKPRSFDRVIADCPTVGRQAHGVGLAGVEPAFERVGLLRGGAEEELLLHQQGRTTASDGEHYGDDARSGKQISSRLVQVLISIARFSDSLLPTSHSARTR